MQGRSVHELLRGYPAQGFAAASAQLRDSAVQADVEKLASQHKSAALNRQRSTTGDFEDSAGKDMIESAFHSDLKPHFRLLRLLDEVHESSGGPSRSCPP